MTDLYEVHTCKTCFDADEMTPLQFAARVVNATLDEQAHMVRTPEFDAGWLVGVEGARELTDANACPVGTAGAAQAWSLGHLAGRYAFVNEYDTPTCKTDGHYAQEPTGTEG